MSRAFISGSSTGLGLMAGQLLVEQGHQVVLHGRNQRLVYLSSGMHRSAEPNPHDVTWQKRPWRGAEAYAESKLYDVLLAFAVARRWPGVFSNALEPGWVPTRMGGPGAPDDMDQAHRTQAWLAVSDDPGARVTGQYFYHMRPRAPNPLVHDVELQEELIEACRRLSGVALPP
jgi:NAD(P)-dependent dehydrogenase (short-subunit alcohol dehydrogenase family)